MNPTSGTTPRPNTTNRRASRNDGRRTVPASIGSDRQRIKDMQRRTTGSTNYDFVSEIYTFTGTISRLVSNGSLKADYGVKALEACREVSRHFFQGNTTRAWIDLKNLIEAFGIATKTDLDQPERTRTRKLFTTLTADENRRPEWNSLSAAVLDFYAALGVELRPLRVQLGVDPAKRDPQSFDPEAGRPEAKVIDPQTDLALTGPRLGAGMAMAGSNADEAYSNK